MTFGQVQLEWARVWFESLADAGVTDVVSSPGSRSTPLVLGAVACSRLTIHDVVDERSAAFFALGQARVTGRPSVCVCTSGTAGAHYLPAVIEASAAGVPLVVVTADRPLELVACGALQTTDQVKLFGDHARAFFELGHGEADAEALRSLRRRAAQAVATTLYPRPGAVHVNARARKPLEPDASELGRPLGDVARDVLARPVPEVSLPIATPTARTIEALAAECARAERGLLVLGPDAARTPEARRAVAALARATGFVVLPEATSGLRFCAPALLEGLAVVSSFDALLRSSAFRAAHAPDLVLCFGATPTSSAIATYLAAHRAARQVVVTSQAFSDPDASVAHFVFGESSAVASLLAARLAELIAGSSTRPTTGPLAARPADDGAPGLRAARARWAEAFAGADELARDGVDAELDRARAAGLSEGLVARAVLTRAPRGEHVLLGNGLSIRHADTFVRAGDADVVVLAQRGVSGIDGLVSAAAGAASVAGAGVTLFAGDVSVLHDLGGLAVAATVRDVPLSIVVLHNDGGRIFEQLPVARLDGLAPGTMEHFTTPHGRSFAGAASMFGLAHHAVHTLAELERALDAARGKPGATLIEAIVPAHDAQETHSRLWGALDRRLGEALSRRSER